MRAGGGREANGRGAGGGAAGGGAAGGGVAGRDRGYFDITRVTSLMSVVPSTTFARADSCR